MCIRDRLYRLRELGFDVKLFDAGQDLGGVWHWNCYPGARVDSHVPNYEYSIEEVWRDWCWSERFPGWEELRRYFAHVDEKLDLSRDIEFQKQVVGATFDEERCEWQVRCGDGELVRANFFLTCFGFAAKANMPSLPGLDEFAGTAVHTAHWPQDGFDMTNKRVGVIGTGASGVQVIQEAGKVAKQLTVFQRTPMIALAMQQRELARAEEQAKKSHLKEVLRIRNASSGGFYDLTVDPRAAHEVGKDERDAVFEEAWAKGGFHFWTGTFSDIILNEQSNRLAYDFWREKVHSGFITRKSLRHWHRLNPRIPLAPNAHHLNSGTTRFSIKTTLPWLICTKSPSQKFMRLVFVRLIRVLILIC